MLLGCAEFGRGRHMTSDDSSSRQDVRQYFLGKPRRDKDYDWRECVEW
jgi:hypothetical protein